MHNLFNKNYKITILWAFLKLWQLNKTIYVSKRHPVLFAAMNKLTCRRESHTSWIFANCSKFSYYRLNFLLQKKMKRLVITIFMPFSWAIYGGALLRAGEYSVIFFVCVDFMCGYCFVFSSFWNFHLLFLSTIGVNVVLEYVVDLL